MIVKVFVCVYVLHYRFLQDFADAERLVANADKTEVCAEKCISVFVCVLLTCVHVCCIFVCAGHCMQSSIFGRGPRAKVLSRVADKNELVPCSSHWQSQCCKIYWE